MAWLLVVCALAGHNAYLWLVKRIVPDTNILALLPVQERDPVLQQSFTHMVDSAQQRVIVLVGAADWENARRAAAAYSAVVASAPGLIEPTKISDDTQADWLAPFERHRLSLLTPEQVGQLNTDAPQLWADGAMARLYSAFSGPRLGSFRDDPFGLFGSWVQERARETPVRPRDGTLFVAGEGRQFVVMPMLLKESAFSIGAQQRLIPLLERAEAAAIKASADAKVVAAGVVLHAAAAGGQAEAEMSTIGVGTLVGIMLLTWFAFRSLRPIGMIMLSIGVGFLGSLSVCWLLFGELHLLTLVFGASLIGVAQDYGIYFLCNRLTADDAVDSASLLRRLLPSLLLTLMAAVIGYMGLALTPFPGLRAMAVFSAVGLIFAWLTVVCWFPAMIGPGVLKSGALARVNTQALSYWPQLTMNGMSLAVMAAFAVLATIGCMRLTTNDDIRSLQTPPKRLLEDQILLGKLLDVASPVQYFLVRGGSAEEVLQREETLKLKLDGLIKTGVIGGYHAMSNWVPSAKAQVRNRMLVEDKLLGSGAALGLLAKGIGEDGAWEAATRTHLTTAVAPLTPEAFLKTAPSEPWRHLWLGEDKGIHASIVALRGLKFAALDKVRVAGDKLPGVQWVDKVGEISTVLGRYREMMGIVVIAAYVIVFALLVPRYRRRAWRVVAPAALASIATLAALGFMGQPLQLFHVLALMLLLGVSIDYGIFMQEKGSRSDSTSWLAVGLAAVSTILSFGLLGLSRTPALQAFGITMLIGVTTCWLLVPLFGSATESEHAA